MRLIMACFRTSTTAGARHGKTSAGGHGTGRASTDAGSGGRDAGGLALRTGGATSSATRCNPGGNRCGNGRRACHGAQVPSAFAQTAGAARGAAAKMGRSAPGLDERGRGAQLSGPVGEALRRGRDAGGVAAACGAVAAARTPGGGLGRIPPAGTPRLAQGSARHSASQERPRGARGMGKNCPKHWLPC
jgi:hypothetical protein